MTVTWLPSSTTVSIEAIGVGVGGVLVLRAFYQVFSSQWPENYFGGAHGVDPVVSRSPIRYLGFRSIPVFLAAFASGVLAARFGAPP